MTDEEFSGKVIVYGGSGSLGSKCVSTFKNEDYWVGAIGTKINSEANINIIVNQNENFADQESTVLEKIGSIIRGKLDAVICVAGGWAGGNSTTQLIQTTDAMCRKNLWSSLIAASLAARYLKEGGLLVFTGARVALEATPGMIGYGIAKAAVHHLAKSLAGEDSGLPRNTKVLAILPNVLDTPNNRRIMPHADTSNWTPVSYVAELVLQWCKGNDVPVTGSLVKVATESNRTSILVA